MYALQYSDTDRVVFFFLNFKILTNQYFSKKAASYLETEVILNVV